MRPEVEVITCAFAPKYRVQVTVPEYGCLVAYVYTVHNAEKLKELLCAPSPEPEYAGWSNRETWAVSLQINNTVAMYHAMVNVLFDEPDDRAVGPKLKAVMESYMHMEDISGFRWEMVQAALAHVNWVEIAQKNREV